MKPGLFSMGDSVIPGEVSKPFRIVGALILLASCGFLVGQVLHSWQQLPEFDVSLSVWYGWGAASLVYALSLSLLAVAWQRILRVLCSRKVPAFPEIFSAYMRTQVAKYLPGNIFHYVGRVEVLRRHGVARAELVLSLAYETMLLLVLAVAIGGGAALSLGFVGLADLDFPAWWLAGGMAGAMLAVWGVHHWRPGPFHHLPSLHRKVWFNLAVTVLLYAAYFFLFSAILLWLATLLGRNVSYPVCLAAACLPWAIGFVTPGAPGGLGVREAMVVFVLNHVMPPLDSLVISALMRLVTVVGDLMAYALSYVYRSKS